MRILYTAFIFHLHHFLIVFIWRKEILKKALPPKHCPPPRQKKTILVQSTFQAHKIEILGILLFLGQGGSAL